MQGRSMDSCAPASLADAARINPRTMSRGVGRAAETSGDRSPQVAAVLAARMASGANEGLTPRQGGMMRKIHGVQRSSGSGETVVSTHRCPPFAALAGALFAAAI